MDETRKDALRVDFDRAVKLEFYGSTVSSDGRLLLCRDRDEAFALTAMVHGVLTDLCTESNVQHSMTALLLQSIYSRLVGYDDFNDAERLAVGPVMQQIVGGRAVNLVAASTSHMVRFETEVLTQSQNLSALKAMLGQWNDRVCKVKPINKLVLDLGDVRVAGRFGAQWLLPM